MLSVPGLAKDQESPICAHYFRNTVESTHRAECKCLTGYHNTVFKQVWIPTGQSQRALGIQRPLLTGCCRTLQAGVWRLTGLHVVCAVTMWCWSAFKSLASTSLSEVLQAFQQPIATNVYPCREQTVHCSHLSPRWTSGWDGTCMHTHSSHPATAASGAHLRVEVNTQKCVCVRVCVHARPHGGIHLPVV